MNSHSVRGKSWIFKKYNENDVKKICEDFFLSEIVSKLLSIRKKYIQDISIFLNPSIKNLFPNPMNLKDMKTAVERVYKCIEKNETVGVFGDYDVDGATSTALLIQYFQSLNLKVNSYIPDRKKEGYGPSEIGFNNLIKLSKLLTLGP